MAFLIGGANSSADAAYDIENSLRLDSASSAYLYRDQVDPTSEGLIYTVSVWNKICFPDGQNATLLEGGDEDGSGATVDETFFMHNVAGTLFFQDALNDATVLGKQTASLQRDVSAWYHFMLSVDTTQGTDTNRLKVYINNTDVSANMTGGWPVQNVVHHINKETSGANQLAHYIGRQMRGATYSDMYVADVAFVDGTQLTPSSFGETDEDSGIWKPKSPSVTWGDNGFFLEFKNSAVGSGTSSTIGADTSGNDNHFTSSGVATTDQTTDTPTNNFCTMNPLANQMGGTLSEGNLKLVEPGAVDKHCFSTFGLTSGKWYFECKVTVQGARGEVGVTDTDHGVTSSGTNYALMSLHGGTVSSGGGTANSDVGSGFSTGDILCVAMDLDNGQVWFSEDADIDIGTTANVTGLATSGLDRDYRINSRATGSPATTYEYNFGNPSFSISSSNADADDYGNFEYAVPSGYYALCTKNLAEFG